jgi:hypothetical protein
MAASFKLSAGPEISNRENGMGHGKKGSLIVVGSGIKSVGHITLEARGWIRESDITVYCVADPATDVWIQKNARAHFDLYSLYGNDKPRIDTYNDMTQVMLDNVRAGRDTCAVFYGHPGVFVLPTHRAIQILRAEGYRAAMLPAVSALDCLWADVGVDPSTVGCLEYEATDMLLRRRPVQKDSHVVIWQIGCVGDAGFNFAGYDNRNLDVLVDYLLDFYLPDHQVIHYQGSQYPMCPSRCDTLALAELRHAPVTGISTLYIPPQSRRGTDIDMGVRLGLIDPEAAPEMRRKQAEAQALADQQALARRKAREAVRATTVSEDGATAVTASAHVSAAATVVAEAPAPYRAAPARAAPVSVREGNARVLEPVGAGTLPAPETAVLVSARQKAADDEARQTAIMVQKAASAAEREATQRKKIIQQRRSGPYSQYVPARGENALAEYIARMMENPRVLAEFLRDPGAATQGLGLSEAERGALVSLHAGRIRMAMKDAPT